MNTMRSYVERRMPLLYKVIMPLNRRGVMVDQKLLAQFRKERTNKVRTWQSRAKKHFKANDLGDLPIGPAGGYSYKKMRQLLYEDLKLPIRVDPEDGRITTNQEALKSLEPLDPSGTISVLLENSRLAEARNALQVKVSFGGRARSRYVLGGDEKFVVDEVGKESPASGRLASRGNNLQNITEWVRAIYVPRHKDRWLVKADYSQIEIRLTAYLSGDPELQKAVDSDAYTYAMYLVDRETDLYGLWKRGFSRLLKDYKGGDPPVVHARDETKRTALAWSYRMGPKKFERVYGVPFSRGKKALQTLDTVFSRVPDWWDRVVKEVVATSGGSGFGYLTNAYGRIRWLFVDDVPAICNFLPQSTAADILFDAMEELEEGLKAHDSELVLTAHDELVIDTPDPDVVLSYIKKVMEKPKPELPGLSIPVTLLVGKNWAKYHKHGVSCKGTCSKPENLKGQQPWENWQ